MFWSFIGVPGAVRPGGVRALGAGCMLLRGGGVRRVGDAFHMALDLRQRRRRVVRKKNRKKVTDSEKNAEKKTQLLTLLPPSTQTWCIGTPRFLRV